MTGSTALDAPEAMFCSSEMEASLSRCGFARNGRCVELPFATTSYLKQGVTDECVDSRIVGWRFRRG